MLSNVSFKQSPSDYQNTSPDTETTEAKGNSTSEECAALSELFGLHPGFKPGTSVRLLVLKFRVEQFLALGAYAMTEICFGPLPDV